MNKFLILLITVFFLSVEVPPVLYKGAKAQLKSPPKTICTLVYFLRLSLSLECQECHLGCKCCRTKTLKLHRKLLVVNIFRFCHP